MPAAVAAARQLIQSRTVDGMMHKPQLVPTVEGDIQLEWHTVDIDLIIERPPSGPTSYYLSDLKRDMETEGSLQDPAARLPPSDDPGSWMSNLEL